jgi:DNA-binding NtrC family response regulator
MKYTWPGNIRELKNLLEQLVILSNENGVFLNDLPNRFLKKEASPPDHPANEQSINMSEAMPCEGSLSDAVDALEIDTIKQAMRKSGGVKAKAAQKLGISRYALLRKLKRFSLFQE